MIFNNRYIKFILYATLFISVLVSLNIAVRRFKFEKQNNRVEIVMSYRDLARLAVLEGISVDGLLNDLKEKTNLTSVAIEEDTLTDFVEEGRVSVLKGSEVMNMYRVGYVNRYLLTHLYKQVKVEHDHFYLVIDEREDYERIRDFLRVELGKDRVMRIGQYNILEIVDDYEDLMQIGLGVSKRKLEKISELGFHPLLRLKNSNRLTQDIIQQKFLSFVGVAPPTTIIFDGDAVLGYPSEMPYIQSKLEDNGYNFGFVEFSNQLGEKSLSKAIPKRVVRVHSIPEEQMAYLPREKAKSRYFRAVKERGIKILYLHPFFQVFGGGSILTYNIEFIQDIYEGLLTQGFDVGAIQEIPMDGYKPAANWESLILSLGVLTTILFLLDFYFPFGFKRHLVVYTVFLALFYLSYLTYNMMIWNKVMALLTAIMFPTLALVSQFPNESDGWMTRNTWLHSVFYLLRLLGVSFLGAALIVGFLSDIQFLLGIETFTGVKLSFVAPLILVGLFFFLRPHRISSWAHVLKRLINAPVKTVALLAFFMCVSFVGVLILRSGNYFSFPVLFFEGELRAFLENTLFIRPRTKEFLIGYPFLFLAFMQVDKYISRNWVWFFNVIGVVALISLVNSFCHVHTPLIVSIHRTILGIVIGFFVGIIYLIGYKLSIRFYHYMTR